MVISPKCPSSDEGLAGESAPVVADAQDDLVAPLYQRDRDVAGVGVLGNIVEAFLGDVMQCRLQRRAELITLDHH